MPTIESPARLLAGAGLALLLSGCPARQEATPATPPTAKGPPTAPRLLAGIPSQGPGATAVVLATNDLGMHCTDVDFQVFSILPPFNGLRAQVVAKGTATTPPALLGGAAVDVYYAAASSPVDPAGAGSINTGSAVAAFKSNFWDPVPGTANPVQTHGTLTYRLLYPAGVLDQFGPLARDRGLPVPDSSQLPALVATQQAMPSVGQGVPTNTPQPFNRFDVDFAFFRLPLAGLAGAPVIGTTVAGVNWFAADGLPIQPVDDAGVANPFPLMRIAAVAKGTVPTSAGNVLAAVDLVVPVASETNCEVCHAASGDPGLAAAGLVTPAAGAAADRASTGFAYLLSTDAAVPPPERLLNAAKINILRLHDRKHGAGYLRWSGAALAPAPCTTGQEASCLDRRRHIQCSQCHYTPALDLAQVGPIDEPAAGPDGRQQRTHVSMTRAMHGFHGGRSFQGAPVFPPMPVPGGGRTAAQVQGVLLATCYTCHPGKKTSCLRGAMFTGGVICQDCHGNMAQIGNDFSGTLSGATPGQVSAGKRIPWANEPRCQSCHVGDAATAALPGVIEAGDGLRLAQAYTVGMAAQPVLQNIAATASRFADNGPLYRLSTGHGGLICEACHGPTHAEWPNATPNANDNVAALQLQGHAGPIAECTVCHAAGSLAPGLAGPHGLHPVGDSRFVSGHEGLARSNRAACQACHGLTGLGTVLSRAAAARTFAVEGRTVTIAAGTRVGCGLCHGNVLAGSALAPLTVSSAGATAIALAPGGQVALGAAGGARPYRWTVAGNAGGSLLPGGVYTAGAGAGVDVVTVTDANGRSSTVTITVGGGGAGGGGPPSEATGAPALSPLQGTLLAVLLGLVGSALLWRRARAPRPA